MTSTARDRAWIGYTLSSEEHGPRELVELARRAEEAGFDFVTVSDHFHPWIDRQGQSPFVWAVLGAIACATDTVDVLTAVTCPTMRIHPAIVAQAAATTAAMMPGRFRLGLGTGERLNEHVVGARWPVADERIAMLGEAVEIIRRLWTGDLVTMRTEHFAVEQARLYTLPEEPPELLIGAAGPRAAELAGAVADGLIGVGPSSDTIRAFEEGGGSVKPRYAQIHVCYEASTRDAIDRALRLWPTAALPGELGSELSLPRQFEQAAQLVDADAISRTVVCGPDEDRYLEAIEEVLDAGFDHVFVHQVGPDQDAFLAFFATRILPALRESRRLGGRFVAQRAG